MFDAQWSVVERVDYRVLARARFHGHACRVLLT